MKEVKEAVKKELAGPGKLLGYRAMQKKIDINHDLYVGRDKMYDMMTDLDQEGLAARGGVGKKKHRRKGNFTSLGPNWVHSLDGHDKLMAYQNSTFPIAVYGCLDTASRKLLWLRFSAFIYPSHGGMLRVDKGTETGTMGTMDAFLRSNHEDEIDPVDTIIYGPSTSNQIERWWKELHERLEKFFKVQLNESKNHAHYNPDDDVDRYVLPFLSYFQLFTQFLIHK
eukprot:gene8459-9364_t